MREIEIVKTKGHYVVNIYDDVDGKLSYVHINYKEAVAHVAICLEKWESEELYSGMSLDEIQKAAGKTYDDATGNALPITQTLAMLVANLAARMQELVVNEQGFVHLMRV